MDLMTHRRALLARVESEPEAEYIQNGLLYQFVSDDSDGQTWVDRINGLTFTLANVSKAQDNGLYFNGSAIGVCPDASLPSNCTMEIVFNIIGANSDYYILLFSQKDQNIGIITKNSRFRVDNPPRNREYLNISNIGKATASTTNTSNDQLAVLNASTLTEYTSAGTFGKYYSGIQIGARANADGSSRNYGLVGELYQIRVYDRKLSETEILFNQAIDIAKYHIQV